MSWNIIPDNSHDKTSDRILVIEDQEDVRRMLASFLEISGYDIRTAANGLDGLLLLEQWQADLVTVDLNMPVMSGQDFIERAAGRWPDLPIVVVSGVGAVAQAIEALHLGACDFVTKPIENLSLLQITIDKALGSAELIRQNRDYQQNLEQKVEKRTIELEETKRQLLYSLGKTAEYRDTETGRHVIRVGKICALLGKAMGMPASLIKALGEAAPLHDIGKIGVSDTILLKPGKLTPKEWDIMKTHCEIGCDILRHHTSARDHNGLSLEEIVDKAQGEEELYLQKTAMAIALCHHERWDGHGYPWNLSGTEIPLVARIVAVVDVYDALGSERPYKTPLPEDVCQNILREGSGNHFDPRIIEEFFANINTIVAIKREWMD